MKSGNITKIMGNRKKIFASYGLIGYIGHFFLIVSALNLYSDGDRFISCGTSTAEGREESSAVYDTALMLLSIYHIIEWARFTIMLTAIFVGVNLMIFWYILGLNSLFGFAAYIACHYYRLNADGKACAEH